MASPCVDALDGVDANGLTRGAELGANKHLLCTNRADLGAE